MLLLMHGLFSGLADWHETLKLSSSVALVFAGAQLAAASFAAAFCAVIALKEPDAESVHASPDALPALLLLVGVASLHVLINTLTLGCTGKVVVYGGLTLLVAAASGVWLCVRLRRRWRWPGVSVPNVLCALMSCAYAIDGPFPLGLMAFGYGAALSLNLVAFSREEFDAQCAGSWSGPAEQKMRRATLIASIAFLMFLVGAGLWLYVRQVEPG